MKRTLVFPGQGTQIVGMGKTVADSYPAARAVFQEVDEALGESLSNVIWGDCQDTLNLTANAQPALMATSMAVLKAVESEGFDIGSASFLAGHSLGEYTALCAARSITLTAAAKLLRIRGEAMQKAVPVGEGAMAALFGLDIESAELIAAEASEGGVCEISNDNDPRQIVISGHVRQVEKVMEIAAGKGARRTVRLSTSAPFHCSLMRPAVERMRTALAETEILPPVIPVIANVTAEPVVDGGMAAQLLVRQITGRVRWRETVLRMRAEGVESAVEIGAGNVLSGMIRRTASSISTAACGSPEQIQSLAAGMRREFNV